MLQVNQTAQVTITGYTSQGEGVCRVDGCAVFVPNALRGETCQITVTHVGRTQAHGRIDRLAEPSPHRVDRLCPWAKQCGGCQLWHMDYTEELTFKAQKVLDALTRIGGQTLQDLAITGGGGETVQLSDLLSGRATPAKHPVWAYRNKAQFPVQARSGKVTAGFFRQGTHQVVPVERCLIQDETADLARRIVLDWARRSGVTAYDETAHRGLLRHIFVRKGFVTGQVMVCLVCNGDGLPRRKALIDALRKGVPGLASVILCRNTARTNVVLGDRFETLWGADEIEDELCGLRFRLSPRSFYQVNHDQAQRLYEAALKLADLTKDDTVLDLYCGTGTITLALARDAGRAVGVELVEQAIQDAKDNARRNGVTNAAFFCADAGEAARRFATHLSERFSPAQAADTLPADDAPITEAACEADAPASVLSRSGGPDVIVVDPPRKGLSRDVVEAILTMAPKRVVYISCDPATLARDLKLLTQGPYTLSHAQAFDLFPRTYHVETVVSLSQLKSDV